MTQNNQYIKQLSVLACSKQSTLTLWTDILYIANLNLKDVPPFLTTRYRTHFVSCDKEYVFLVNSSSETFNILALSG